MAKASKPPFKYVNGDHLEMPIYSDRSRESIDELLSMRAQNRWNWLKLTLEVYSTSILH
jgi:hypothetical protein